MFSKQSLITLIALILMLSVSNIVLAAVHNPDGLFSNIPSAMTFTITNPTGASESYSIFPVNLVDKILVTTDPWYSIQPDQPSFKAGFYTCVDDPLYTAQYYLNDQTFVSLNYQLPGAGVEALTNLRASYLSNFGFFLGVDYYTQDDYDETVISPGYRIKLNESSYLALSCDYLSTDDDTALYGYDLDLKYYYNKSLFFGQWYHLQEEGENQIDLGLYYQAQEQLTLALVFKNANDEDGFEAGCTWTAPLMTMDAKYGLEPDDYHYYAVSCLFNMGQHFNLGAEYGKTGDNDTVFSAKMKFFSKKFGADLVYSFETDDDPAELEFTYHINY